MSVTVNKGKDFSLKTAEVKVKGDPGALISYTGCDFVWYSRNGCTFMTEEWVRLGLSKVD